MHVCMYECMYNYILLLYINIFSALYEIQKQLLLVSLVYKGLKYVLNKPLFFSLANDATQLRKTQPFFINNNKIQFISINNKCQQKMA